MQPIATATTATATTQTLPTGSTPTTAHPIAPPVSAPGTLTYALPAGTTENVVAAKPCWIEVRTAPGGPVTFAGTLQSGQSRDLTSPLWMRLGYPAHVTVTARNTTLRLPAGPGDLIIAPS